MGLAKDLGGALIGAGGQVVGGVLQSRAQNKATEAQERANAAALAFSKEQDVYNRAQYENALRLWDASRRSLLSRYGIDLPASTLPAFAGAVTGGGMPGVPMSPGQPVRGGTQMDQAAPMVPGPEEYAVAQGQGPTLADVIRSRGRLGSAFDWRGAGLE